MLHTLAFLLGIHRVSSGFFLLIFLTHCSRSLLFFKAVGNGNNRKGGGQSHGVEPMLQPFNSHFGAAHFVSFCSLSEQPTTIQFRWPNPLASISKKAKQIQHYVRKIRSKLWVCGTSN